MKTKLIALFLVLCQAIPLFAQEESKTVTSKNNDDEIKTLFKKTDHPVKIGYYIGPEFSYTQFKGRDVFLGGLSLGVILNHFFSVGLCANGIMNPGNLWYNNVDTNNSRGAYLYGGYGGVKFEFMVLPTSLVHVNFPILIGGGGLVYNTGLYHTQNHNYSGGSTLDWDSFFVVQPGVMVEINLLKFLRFDAGISYRYTPDLNLINTSSGLINNFNANVSVKFGKF
ncbi:MAG: hypothetical protein NT004_07265 [Bacteroidetes bacterium]|nr:hypothetical protein [Bacteroidota bacterium]